MVCGGAEMATSDLGVGGFAATQERYLRAMNLLRQQVDHGTKIEMDLFLEMVQE